MIPQEHISWLVDQKDSVLSVTEIRKKNLAINRLLPTVMDPFHQPFLLDVVRRDLPRNLNVLQPILLEELRKAIESTMGLQTDSWREVPLWQTMRTIIKKVGNRVLYDLPLCEDPGFLKSIENFSSWMGIGAFISGQLLPWPLRPYAGSLIAIPIYFNLRSLLRSLVPVVKKRRDDIQHGVKSDNNFLSWFVEAVLNGNADESMKTPEVMAEQLVQLVSKAERVRFNDMP